MRRIAPAEPAGSTTFSVVAATMVAGLAGFVFTHFHMVILEFHGPLALLPPLVMAILAAAWPHFRPQYIWARAWTVWVVMALSPLLIGLVTAPDSPLHWPRYAGSPELGVLAFLGIFVAVPTVALTIFAWATARIRLKGMP